MTDIPNDVEITIEVGEQGPPGPRGVDGRQGANGRDGNFVRYGNGAPSSSIGYNRDFYIDVQTYTLYGPKYADTWPAGVSLVGPQGATGNAGTNGTNGTNGNTVLYGAVAPNNSQGINGNFYIDYVAHYIYGPKAGGVWPAGVSIVGPQGNQGVQGVQGVQGATGPAGTSILYGAVDPTFQGNNGDFFINTTSHYLFGPKTAGVWPAGVSLVGSVASFNGRIGSVTLSGSDVTTAINGQSPTLGSATVIGGAAGNQNAPSYLTTNILLYYQSGNNWAGIASNTAGGMYFVTDVQDWYWVNVFGSSAMHLTAAGALYNATGVYTISDIRLKDVKGDAPRDGLATIKQLQVKRATWKDTAFLGDEEFECLIAQDTQRVKSSLVSSSGEITEHTPDGKLGIKDNALVLQLVKAVQELSAEVDALKARLLH